MNEDEILIAEMMRKLAPALKNVDDQTLVVWITLADAFVCPDKFGDKYVTAMALYTMHLMFMDGAMKSEKESLGDYSRRVTSFTLSGEFSTSYGSVTANNSGNSIYDTPWGKMFAVLNKKKGGGFGLISAAGRGCSR